MTIDESKDAYNEIMQKTIRTPFSRRITRKEWCEFSSEESQAIIERDKGRCVYCGSDFYLGKAHVFVSRAHGGKGCRENGVLLCQLDHQRLDQGNDSDKRKRIQKFCENYLHRIYGDINIEELKYNKWNMF